MCSLRTLDHYDVASKVGQKVSLRIPHTARVEKTFTEQFGTRYDSSRVHYTPLRSVHPLIPPSSGLLGRLTGDPHSVLLLMSSTLRTPVRDRSKERSGFTPVVPSDRGSGVSRIPCESSNSLYVVGSRVVTPGSLDVIIVFKVL